jgi:hypothetical protein
MRVPTVSRRRRREAAIVAVVLTLAFALSAAMSSLAAAVPRPGPAVPAAGVGTKAALDSPSCGDDGHLAYPYQQRAPCTRPLKKGESNGGATTMGVDKDTIKVVLFVGTKDQQQASWSALGQSPPKDHATGQNGYVEDAYRDWSAVMAHSYNTWGRKVELDIVTPTGADEAAQHADALTVAEKKPFAVIVQVPTVNGNAVGAGQVFANDLVAKKILVFYGGTTNAEAAKQAPYRWLGGMDSNAAAVNGVQFAARQLQGQTAKWSGDFVNDKRVFGAVYPERGIDWQYFDSTAKKEGLKVASGAELKYSVPLDTSQTSQVQQQEAPQITAKLKDSGVTTVLLYAPYTLIGYLFKAADSLDYHPEWVLPGYAASDIEVTARINNASYPDQMKHVFGLGTLQPYVDGLQDPQEAWFDWYWGPNTGTYGAGPAAPLYTLYAGVSLAGPKLTPKLFQQGLFAMPANGGAASNQVVTFMFGYGRTSGLPYDEYSQVGLDYAVLWWSPTDTGKGKILFDDGTGRFRYIDGAKRYYAGQWKKGEPKLFDTSNSIAQFDSLPASDAVPDYPCKGCPSTTS